MGKGIVINISGSGEGAAEALRLIEEKMAETAARGEAMGARLSAATNSIGEAMENTVPRTAAASGAIRELEGNLPIRAVERFLSDTLHLGPALQAAFPLVGAIAFFEMFNRIREEIGKVMDSSNAAADNIRKDWTAASNEIERSSNALDTQIDRTATELDKLLKRSSAEDTLALAFDVDREAADKLAESIDKDIKKFDELSKKKENTVGFWGSVFTGKEETRGSEAVLKGVHDKLESAKDEYDAVVAQAGASGNKDNLDQAQVARINGLQLAYDKATANITKALKAAQSAQDTYEASGKTFGKDQMANINLLEGALRDLAEQQRSIGTQFAESQTHQALESARGKSQDDKNNKREISGANRSDIEDAAIDRMIDEEAKKEEAAIERMNAAQLKLAEAQVAARLAIYKSGASIQLAQLEEQRRAELITESQFLQAKLKLTEDEIEQERKILNDKSSDIKSSIKLEGPTDTPRKLELEAQLVAVEAQLAELADQRARAEFQTTGQIEAQLEAQKRIGAELLKRDSYKSDEDDFKKSQAQKQKLSSQVTSSVTSTIDQLAAGAIRGKMNFKEMADSIIMDMERLAMKVIAERWIGPAIASMFGLGGGPAGNGYSSPAEISNIETNVAPAFAGGGEIPDGGMAIVGDGGDGSGSELFAPKGPGTVLPHEVLEGIAKGGAGGAGAPSVTVNNVNNSSSAVQMKQTGVTWDSSAREFVINTMLEDMQNGGPTAMAMKGFGSGS